MNKLSTFFLMSFLALLAQDTIFGQRSIGVSLTDCDMHINPFSAELYTFRYLGVDSKSLSGQHTVWKLSIQPQLTLQKEYIAGKIDSSTFIKYNSGLWFDLDSIERLKLKYEILASSRIINDSLKEIVLDQNFNGSFADDPSYVFPTQPRGLYKAKNGTFRMKDVSKLYNGFPTINLVGEVIDWQGIKKWPLSFKLIPYNTMSIFPDSVKIGSHYVGMEVRDAMVGKYYYGGLGYEVFVKRNYYFGTFKRSHDFIIKEEQAALTSSSKSKLKRVGERFNLGTHSFIVDSISANFDFASIKAFKDTLTYGFDINQIVPSFKATLLSNAKFDYDDFRGKVLLINFWGSWCQPCIKELPELVIVDSVYSKRSDFAILSVAFEHTENLTAVKRLIDRYHMRWRQSVEFQRTEQDRSEYLVNMFNVTFFPTTIILNREGRVIFRGSGLMDLPAMKTKLRSELEQ